MIYFNKCQPITEPVLNDKFQVSVKILRDSLNNFYSLTKPKNDRYHIDDFLTYGKSLMLIDNYERNNSTYNGIEQALGVKIPMSNYSIDDIVPTANEVVANAFWNWIQFPINSYFFYEEDPSTSSFNNEEMISVNDNLRDRKYHIIPYESNRLLDIYKGIIPLPKGSSVSENNGVYLIRNKFGHISIEVVDHPRVEVFKYSSKSKLIENTFKIFNFDKSAIYVSNEVYIKVHYTGYKKNRHSEESQTLRNWYKMLKKKVEKEFSFEILRKLLIEM